MNPLAILAFAQEALALTNTLIAQGRNATTEEVKNLRAKLDADLAAAGENLNDAVADRRARDAAESSGKQP